MRRYAPKQPNKERKPFGGSAVIGGSAVKETNGPLQRQGHTASAGPSPPKNHMLDSLKGYLENIAAAATQNVAKGGPLAELASSLEISVDTVAKQQQEMNCLYKQINDLKKRGTQASRIGTVAGGILVGTVCTHCEAVGHTVSHRNNACYFDPKK